MPLLHDKLYLKRRFSLFLIPAEYFCPRSRAARDHGIEKYVGSGSFRSLNVQISRYNRFLLPVKSCQLTIAATLAYFQVGYPVSFDPTLEDPALST